MTNYAKIDTANHRIVMDRTFAKNAEVVGSTEYKILQACRADYPDYAVVRREIKKNPLQEHYNGLTYKYMEEYIVSHEDPVDVIEVLHLFNEMKLIAACHSRGYRYPIIKRWFLNRYPEVVDFGLLKNEPSKVVALPKQEETPEAEKKEA